jgi:hypothetical protein
VGESEPFARGDALLEEVRLLAAREDASESVRDEYGTMLGNAIYARHRARAGEGIPGLLTASRALAARAEATPKQAGDHMRALRNAALHYASQGAWSEAKALRDEARAFLASQGPTEATSAQFTYLLSDVIAETVTLRAWAELETWLQDLAGHMPREGALGTEHRVHAESLVSAHLAAEEFGADDTLRQARLAALTRAVEAGGATPELLVLLGRALDNRHYFLVQRTEGPLPTDLLARLRATAARAPREGELAIDLAQALERSHGRALALGDEQGAALLLDELRARRTAGPDLPGVRVELLQALRAKHGRLGDAGAFAEADAYLVEMEGLIAREDVTSAEQALLIGAWADQLWDVLHKERVASVPELVQRAVILQQKIDTTDGGEDLLPRVLGQALLWAREAGEAEHERAWMAALRERAERTAASQLARDTLVRQLELVAVAAAEAQDLDALQAGAEELEALAGAADASAYMRRRWAAAWTDIHLEHLRAGRYPDAPALFLTVAALDAAHAPEERYDDLLAVMLLNHHWFGGKRGDTIEASAALAELRKLAAAEGAHPNTAWRLSEGLEAETRFLLERDADRAQSDAILSELRTLAERVGTDERVSDALAAALRQHHWHAGEAGRVPEAVSRKAELSLLAGRATATWKQRVDLAAVLADGVWDASAAEDFERADAWTAELRVLMALPEAPSAIRYQLARALHALHENALEDGRRKQVVGVLDDLRALCAHPDAPAGCHIELAAVLAAEGGRHAVSAGDRPVADRLVRELQERCARPGATELERDALAELLASLAHWRFLTSPDDPGADPEAGLRDLETLRALALREEASEEQQSALDGVLAGSIRTLVAWGRHAEADAAVARLERRAGAAGAGSGTRKHHARALRERAFMHLEAGELEAALALVGQLQRLTDTRPNGTDYLGDFALSVAVVVDAARKAERSALVLPLIEVLERLARENPDQPLARLMLEQARK